MELDLKILTWQETQGLNVNRGGKNRPGLRTHFLGTKILCANVKLSSKSKLLEYRFHPCEVVWVKDHLSGLDSKQEANRNHPQATFT